MGEGDTGAVRFGGAAQGDVFSKREKANEDLYIQKREAEKLEALRQKKAGADQKQPGDQKVVQSTTSGNNLS